MVFYNALRFRTKPYKSMILGSFFIACYSIEHSSKKQGYLKPFLKKHCKIPQNIIYL